MKRLALLSTVLNVSRRIQIAACGILLFAGACSDSPLAPQQQSLDRVAAARIVPAVTDARVRLAAGVENLAIRERLVHDLSGLESALQYGDGSRARFHVGVLATVVREYRAQQGAVTTDGADVTGVVLMLHAVSQVLEMDFDVPLFTS
jgi:hypothetical protein